MPYDPSINLPDSGFPAWSLPTMAGAIGFAGLLYVGQILAQESTGKDWANLGVIGVITALFAFIITKRDPYIQEKNNELLKHITEKYSSSISKLEEEHSITLKSIVMDHKEILKSTVERLVDEKRSQREGMHLHAEKQLERVIVHFESQMTRFVEVLREDDADRRTRVGSNDKGGGA